MIDKRYQAIRERLSTLSNTELQRIVDNIDLLCLDTFNYDDGKYCPLALAMNLHVTVNEPTDKKIKNEIGKRFTPVNILTGIEGDFYRVNRLQDIVSICNQLLNTI